MNRRFRIWICATAAGLALAGLGGCAGVAENPAPGATGAGTAVPLRKGMKPDDVRQLLGEPARTQPVTVASGEAEQWIYERGQRTEVRKIAADTQEVPYFDPFTNEMRMILEPVYSDEAVTITEELHLLWLNGELAAWKTEYRTSRSYTR